MISLFCIRQNISILLRIHKEKCFAKKIVHVVIRSLILVNSWAHNYNSASVKEANHLFAVYSAISHSLYCFSLKPVEYYKSYTIIKFSEIPKIYLSLEISVKRIISYFLSERTQKRNGISAYTPLSSCHFCS